MNIPLKTLKNGFSMPVFGLGTWRMGGAFTRDGANDDKANIRAIRAAIESGITHIDTAESYADGHAEELVAQAIKGYDRTKLFIVSKVRASHLHRQDLINACSSSLKRLGTDYLDLYLIHSPNPDIPMEETMVAMDELMSHGHIRAIGVSNFTRERMIDAQRYCKNKIVATQVHYNLMFREPEQKNVLSYCQKNDILLIAWRPVEKGKLTNTGIQILDEMCRKYDKTPPQIAINWLISQPNVVTLSKMNSPAHLTENLNALGWKLEEGDIEQLRKEFPGQQSVSDAVPLQ